jgi:hypothetical protein
MPTELQKIHGRQFMPLRYTVLGVQGKVTVAQWHHIMKLLHNHFSIHEVTAFPEKQSIKWNCGQSRDTGAKPGQRAIHIYSCKTFYLFIALFQVLSYFRVHTIITSRYMHAISSVPNGMRRLPVTDCLVVLKLEVKENIVTHGGSAWVISMGSGLDDWTYWQLLLQLQPIRSARTHQGNWKPQRNRDFR